MRKRYRTIATICMLLIMVLCLAGCGKGKENGTADDLKNADGNVYVGAEDDSADFTIEDLDVPQNITTKAVDCCTVSLSWDAVQDADSYEIQYCTDRKFSGDTTIKTLEVTDRYADVSGLQYETIYYFKVRACETVNKTEYYSEWSDVSKQRVNISHQYEITTEQEGDCNTPGYIIYTCSSCGDTKTMDITYSHAYAKVESVLPTCTDAGYDVYRCPVCGDEYTETVLALGHKESDWDVLDPASCVRTGTQRKYCLRCGVTLLEETIPKQSHTEGEWTTQTAATCTNSGTEAKYCVTCGMTMETRSVSALGHDYSLTSTKEATCTEEGYEKYTCSRCGSSYSDAVEALGHDMVEVNTVEATDESAGYIEYECSRCGYTETKTVD